MDRQQSPMTSRFDLNRQLPRTLVSRDGRPEVPPIGQKMMMEATRIFGPDAHSIRFGRFCFEFRSRTLLEDQKPVSIGERALDILVALIEAHGDLVTKDELLSRVWPNMIVEENTLQFHISTLRKILGRDGSFIKTDWRRGYRFVAEIAFAGSTSSGQRTVVGHYRALSAMQVANSAESIRLKGDCLQEDFGGTDSEQIKHIMDLESEVARLRRAVADLMLGKLILHEAAGESI
jgi:DNA-binding winged helix-turn-helix (wHTH) protein